MYARSSFRFLLLSFAGEKVTSVRKMQNEAAKGEAANPNKIERWLKALALMALDVFDVAVACLTDPVLGISVVICEVAKEVSEEAKLT